MIKDIDILQYIYTKNSVYSFYTYFSKLDNNLKTEFIDIIRRNENMPEFLREVTVTTLLYPNDHYLLTRGSNNNLVQDINNILNDLCIDNEMLNSKRKEFQFMNYSKLLSDGMFNVDFDSLPFTSDAIYQEYLEKKSRVCENGIKSK